MRCFSLALICVLVGVIAATGEASITIVSSSINATAREGLIGPGSNDTFQGMAIPAHTALNAIDGGNYSNTGIDWSLSGGQTILSLDVSQQRTGTLYAKASSEETINFTATSNAFYDISGGYNVTDVGELGEVDILVRLYDSTETLFLNIQHSYSPPSEPFTVGALGGDFFNDVQGSLTGNLIAGHQYQFYSKFLIYSNPDPDLGASAIGNITLKIGPAPEPTSLFLSMFLWGVPMLIYRRRSRSKF